MSEFVIEVSSNYTKLAMLAFLHCFVAKIKIVSTKSSKGIEPETLGMWYLLFLHSYQLS